MRVYHLYDLYKLSTNQWKTPEYLRKIQTIKLRRLIRHAYEKVPYYRELFYSLKIKPYDIRKLEDLQKLPLTTKKQLHELSLKEKTARGIDVKRCRSLSTSGTTGIPLKMFFTPQDSTLMNLTWARAFLACGMKPWYKMVAFIGQQKVKPKKSWYEHFGLWRRKEISTWDKSEYWITEIQKQNPQILVGYVMTFKLLEEAIQKHQIKDINPKTIFHSSSILDSFSRKHLEKVFHTSIKDFYGSEEAGNIAWECEKCGGYHINSDTLIVEVLDNNKQVNPGEQGEVVITNLHSYAMPFIRYQQKDIVTSSEKKVRCGRGFPLLEQIKGRTDDFIVLENGRRIPSHPLYHCIVHIPGIKRWRMIQEKINKLKVEIEPGAGYGIHTQKTIENNLKKLIRDKMEIEICKVDSILINPSSKFRSVLSYVSKDVL